MAWEIRPEHCIDPQKIVAHTSFESGKTQILDEQTKIEVFQEGWVEVVSQ